MLDAKCACGKRLLMTLLEREEGGMRNAKCACGKRLLMVLLEREQCMRNAGCTCGKWLFDEAAGAENEACRMPSALAESGF